MKEDFLSSRLEERVKQDAFRQLRLSEGKVDFCSNDYLGIVKNGLIESSLLNGKLLLGKHGSTGSRLLAGNYPLIEEVENEIANFHEAEAGLIFNSGYDANIGLLSCVPQRGDTVLFDHLSHASLRDGIRLSLAQSYSYHHNDLNDLEEKLKKASGNIFVVTESVFSMDGDRAPLEKMNDLCEKYAARLVVDEAHATGILGDKGEGLVQLLKLSSKCFARMHSFGKALGCHGAIVLGSKDLRNYLINFARSFIYTTALPESSIAAIRTSYQVFPYLKREREGLQELIDCFQSFQSRYQKCESRTPIQVVIIPGNAEVKKIASQLQQEGLDCRPILYPTVPLGRERLRIVIHSFNSVKEIQHLIGLL